MKADIIGGFPCVEPDCKGCGKPLLIENAWMTDGCPCNTPLGINSMNETRWRLLMQLQQRQTRRPQPKPGDELLCMVCAHKSPWGVWDSITGAAVCITCRDKARS